MKSKLMRHPAAAAGLALASLMPALPAAASEDLFKKSNCMACHAIEQKRVGPSMKEVAARYKNDAAVTETLAQRIRAGGSGAWGEMPMPPQPQVSEADARTLAQYILSLR